MKPKILNFIKNANNVLFFFGLIFLICFVGWQMIDSLLLKDRRSYDSIQIVNSAEETATPLEYKKTFIDKIDDIYIYRVRTNQLISSDSGSPEVEHFAMVNRFSGSSVYDDFETVNFLFAKENHQPTLLLPSHALFLDYKLIELNPDPQSYNRTYKTSKHLFRVVLNDDNKDNVLDTSDQIILLASEVDGSNLTTIATNIRNYEVVDDNELLIKQGSTGNEKHVIYNLVTDTTKILNIDIPPL